MSRGGTSYERIARALEFYADPVDQGGAGADVVSYPEIAVRARLPLTTVTEILDDARYTVVLLLPEQWDLAAVETKLLVDAVRIIRPTRQEAQ